ncbi:hypothetical protein EVA_02081 [gut metagenome]|uniref:Uncharacterized protein n=1 Tax=gut metagenome TaxID=749906 RepID=J9GNT6_9ZZZZ
MGLQTGILGLKSGKLLLKSGKLLANFWQTFSGKWQTFWGFWGNFPLFSSKNCFAYRIRARGAKRRGWVAKWQTFEKWAVKWAVNLPAEGVG